MSKDGDVVNYLYPYAILAINLKDINWLDMIKQKVWFKPECENALRMALKRANEIILTHPAARQLFIKNRYVGAGNKDSHNMPCNMVILPPLKRL